jgi:hypothetical protein
MRWWRQADCPVRPVEQQWIEQSLDFFVREFGADRLRGEVVLPTDDYFPGVYRGTREDVQAVLDRLCRHMGVDRAGVELEHYASDANPELEAAVPIESRGSGAAGHFRVRDGRSIIAVRDDQAARPMALVATIAHELGHARLLGERRIAPERQDGEPLTDLLTVFFGMGIFAANAALDSWRDVKGEQGYTMTSRLGYLTEPMYGYGMARYAWLRGETDPAWARHLDTNPRTYLKRGLRHLAQQ